jgi:hypothetical protein
MSLSNFSGGIGIDLNANDIQATPIVSIAEANLASILHHLRYLFTNNKSASIDDIKKECRIDLLHDNESLGLCRHHKKIRMFQTNQNQWMLQYIEKYPIQNKQELLDLLQHEHDGFIGIPYDDIKSCYETITQDIDLAIKSGEIIACRNEETKDRVLFPRRYSYLTQLSGSMTVLPHKSYIKTSCSVTHEIRRGDAINIQDEWFRISSSTKSNSKSEPLRAVAPLSVSSEKEMSSMNVYIEKFDEGVLPLDDVFNCTEEMSTSAWKHGCTNDLRQLWSQTIDEMRHLNDNAAVEKELVALGIITIQESDNAGVVSSKSTVSLEPKQKRMRVSKKQLNTHLEGTEYGDILEAEKAKLLATYQQTNSSSRGK